MYKGTTYVSPSSQVDDPRPRSPAASAPTQSSEPCSVMPRLKLPHLVRHLYAAAAIEDTYSSALIAQLFPPQLNATSGADAHGNEYRPWSSSNTFAPVTVFQNALAASVGAVMIVLPESMMVSKSETAFLPPTETDALPICQKPMFVFETGWNSTAPEKSFAFLPPTNSSEPDEASLNENSPSLTAPCLTAVKKKGS